MSFVVQSNPMRIHIFDVEHGECSAIETPTGHLMLIGAGHNATTNWRPSVWVKQRNQQPACMVLPNMDRDHLSDLPNFEPYLRPASIVRNHSISPEWLRAKKLAESGEVHFSVQTAMHWMGNVFAGDPITPNWGMELDFFCHSIPTFQDTNNLSVVTFVRYSGCGIMFPGDLECAGWKAFLTNPSFVVRLQQTNILIASHHGREGGYCADIFGTIGQCKPNIVVISDKAVCHDTQKHNLYDAHCSGITFGNVTRKVLTTRNDGNITIEVPSVGGGIVYLNQSY
jgi:beta-lactamase superfamily II metal-dependent hydrolase